MQNHNPESLTLRCNIDLLEENEVISLFTDIANKSRVKKLDHRFFITYTNGNRSYHHLYSPVFNQLTKVNGSQLRYYTFDFKYSLNEHIF